MILELILIAWLIKKAIAGYQAGVSPLLTRAEYDDLLRKYPQPIKVI